MKPLLALIKKIVSGIDDIFSMKCECGGTYTDGGGYNHFSCDRCGQHL